MKFEFFKTHKEYKNHKKNAIHKIIFGILFLLLGILILFIKDKSLSHGKFDKFIGYFIELMINSIGINFTSILFLLIGIPFILSGIKDLINNRMRINMP